MLSQFADALFPVTRAQFESHYSLHETMERLRVAMESSDCDGEVAPKEVFIYRVYHHNRRQSRIEFSGEFRTYQGRVFLGGEFAYSRLDRFVWSLFVAASLAAIVVTSILTWVGKLPPESILASVGATVIALVTAGLARFSAPGETAWLHTLIRRTLS